MVVGWYADDWWVGDADDQLDLIRRYGCTVENREQVLNYMIAARKAGRLFTNASIVADSGIVSIPSRFQSDVRTQNLLLCRMDLRLRTYMLYTEGNLPLPMIPSASTSSAMTLHGPLEEYLTRHYMVTISYLGGNMIPFLPKGVEESMGV